MVDSCLVFLLSFSLLVLPSAQLKVIISPSFIFTVAFSVPTIATAPNSRAMIAAWLVRPPLLVTIPATFFKIGSQSGLVVSVTRISPSCSLAASPGELIIRAGPQVILFPTASPLVRIFPFSAGRGGRGGGAGGGRGAGAGRAGGGAGRPV